MEAKVLGIYMIRVVGKKLKVVWDYRFTRIPGSKLPNEKAKREKGIKNWKAKVRRTERKWLQIRNCKGQTSG